MNLPTWREKDGDNGMGRVTSIIHTLFDYPVGMDCGRLRWRRLWILTQKTQGSIIVSKKRLNTTKNISKKKKKRLDSYLSI